MTKLVDPRLEHTRRNALDAALSIFQEDGILAVTHSTVGAKTGISRSTLYRHWPKVGDLHKDAIMRAASPPFIAPRTNGPLEADLLWVLGILMAALNETAWGKIAPQVIALASTDDEVGEVINGFMGDRLKYVQSVFEAAAERGELVPDAPIENLCEMAISVPYFRKFISGLSLDQDWLEGHVDTLCRIATTASPDGET